MSALRGKKILLGVTGSIAAYKSAFLVRLLVKEGALVKVIMTKSAEEFITRTTLAVLSRNPVYSGFFDKDDNSPDNSLFVNHVDLACWADIMIVAPATANTIACFAGGICSQLLHAVYLSAGFPVYIAPAMDEDMYRHPAVKDNLLRIESFGNIIIPAGKGDLASGLSGEGRMAEPEDIIKILSAEKKKGELTGKTCLVTAGPTYEFLDAVRYIGNPSSGKMGFAIAAELARRGAAVHLVTGPSHLQVNHPAIQRTNVTSAKEMLYACMKKFAKADITVMCAAVSDYAPVERYPKKLKKEKKNIYVELTPAPDILEILGKKKKNNQLLIGFAMETENHIQNATKKLKNKNLDLIVLNSLNETGAGFNSDTNKITIIGKDGKVKQFELKPKTEVAKDIANEVVFLFIKVLATKAQKHKEARRIPL